MGSYLPPPWQVHLAYEDNFWSTKMALKGHSMEALSRTKTDYDAFLSNPENLARVRAQLEDAGLSDEQVKRLPAPCMVWYTSPSHLGIR